MRFTYKVHIHESIQDITGRKLNNFTNHVKRILSHPKSWNVDFVYVNNDIDADVFMNIYLTTDNFISKVCGFDEKPLSCANMNTRDIYINEYRWLHGSVKSKMNLEDYRNYVINHEVGHALGFLHEKPRKNCKCPVMHQQTLYVEPGKPNPFPTKKEQLTLLSLWNRI